MTKPPPIDAFCWGQRYAPALVLDLTADRALVMLEKAKSWIPLTKVLAWVQDGQRVQELVSGGDWKWGRRGP